MDKLSVLLVTGVVTIEHRWREVNEKLVTLLESTGRFHVRVTEDFRGCTEETLSNYDVVFVNYDGKKTITSDYERWGETAEDALTKFVGNGGGMVIFHSTVCLDDAAPDELRKLWGLYLADSTCGRRCPTDQFVMEIADEEDPITKGLPKETFIINDDLLAGSGIHPEANVKVLATVLDDLQAYRDAPVFPLPHQPIVIPDNDLAKMPGVDKPQPVCWTNLYGAGRVFGMSLGHAQETLGRVTYLTMLVRGTEWAASGQVTLDPPDRTGENRLRAWPYYSGK